MSFFKKWSLYGLLLGALIHTQSAEAITYVTDNGGYAWEESRAATNLAPAIALGTVGIVGIIAIGVQNSHHSSSSSSYSHSHN